MHPDHELELPPAAVTERDDRTVLVNVLLRTTKQLERRFNDVLLAHRESIAPRWDWTRLETSLVAVVEGTHGRFRADFGGYADAALIDAAFEQIQSEVRAAVQSVAARPYLDDDRLSGDWVTSAQLYRWRVCAALLADLIDRMTAVIRELRAALDV